MTNSQHIKPIMEFANTKHSKTNLTKKIETELNQFSNIQDDIFQKCLSNTFKLLNQLNSNKKSDLDFIFSTIKDMKETSNLKELKGHLSLLNAKLENIIKPKNDIIRREINNDKKIDFTRMKNILFSFKDFNKKIFFNIFYMLSILSYTTDKNVVFRVNNLSDNALIDYLKKNYKFFSFNKMSLDTLYSLCGGKKKFYKHINDYMKNLTNNKSITKFVDPFMGAIGSFYSSYSVIKKNNMKVVLNDLNPALYCLNKQIKSKRDSKKILKNIAFFIQKLFQETNMFEASYKDTLSFNKRLEKIFNYRAKKEGSNRSVLTSSILLFLMNNNFGGNYKTNQDGSTTFSLPKDLKKFDRYFNFVGKVELYSFLYTSVNVRFENNDYKEVIKKHSTKEDTHTTFDPPYFSECFLTISEFEKQRLNLENKFNEAISKRDKNKIASQMNKILGGCIANYGKYGDNFPHEQLLKDLSMIKGDISYFNYSHPLIGKYCLEYGLNVTALGRKSTNSRNTKGGTIKTKYEVFMTSSLYNEKIEEEK